jgi:ribonuclease P protein component
MSSSVGRRINSADPPVYCIGSSSENTREAHLSAEPARPQTPPWLPQAYADPRRGESSGAEAREGPQAFVCLRIDRAGVGSSAGRSPAGVRPERLMRLVTLKRRREFFRVRGGSRWTTPGFVLEARTRGDSGEAHSTARFGFTVTRQTGKATVRNRIRRRLKALVREVAAEHARTGFDYVVFARPAAVDRAFTDLRSDLIKAFACVHQDRATSRWR